MSRHSNGRSLGLPSHSLSTGSMWRSSSQSRYALPCCCSSPISASVSICVRSGLSGMFHLIDIRLPSRHSRFVAGDPICGSVPVSRNQSRTLRLEQDGAESTRLTFALAWLHIAPAIIAYQVLALPGTALDCLVRLLAPEFGTSSLG